MRFQCSAFMRSSKFWMHSVYFFSSLRLSESSSSSSSSCNFFWLTLENGNCLRRQTFRFIQSSYLCQCKIVQCTYTKYGTTYWTRPAGKQAILCISHKVSNFLFIFSLLWEKHWVFFNINSILVYTTFTCNLLCFFFSTVLLYCYRKFIFCFRFPWKYLSACGKNDFSPLLL